MARKPRAEAPSPALLAKARDVHQRLCHEYGCPVSYFHSLDPLSELVSSLLSHRTRNKDSGDAFKALRAKYGGDWQRVIDAPTSEVELTIHAVTWPELKAPRIQQILRAVKERHGSLSLDFLAQMTPADATAWLRGIGGVGPKTAAAVLSFSSLRMRALPVDSHHHRVAERLGLIPKGTSLERAHELLAAQLPADADAQFAYDNHEVLMFHGQRCCFHREPACERCVLADICPSSRVAPKDSLLPGIAHPADTPQAAEPAPPAAPAPSDPDDEWTLFGRF